LTNSNEGRTAWRGGTRRVKIKGVPHRAKETHIPRVIAGNEEKVETKKQARYAQGPFNKEGGGTLPTRRANPAEKGKKRAVQDWGKEKHRRPGRELKRDKRREGGPAAFPSSGCAPRKRGKKNGRRKRRGGEGELH